MSDTDTTTRRFWEVATTSQTVHRIAKVRIEDDHEIAPLDDPAYPLGLRSTRIEMLDDHGIVVHSISVFATETHAPPRVERR